MPSIQQMEAYAELLKAVAQTVDQFAADNISMNNARDWMSQRFAGDLTIDTSDDEGGPRLMPEERGRCRGGVDPRQPGIAAGRAGDRSVRCRAGSRLVQAARMQMARSRQQMLSSMVMLGINRIVVTDGLINAKVVFNFRASDEAQREARAVAVRPRHQLQQEHHRRWRAFRLGRRRHGQQQRADPHDHRVVVCRRELGVQSGNEGQADRRGAGELQVATTSRWRSWPRRA